MAKVNENARLREACRAALAELAEYEDVLRRLSKSRSSDGNYVGAISAACEATGVFVAQRIFNRHLSAAERAEKASDHAE